MNQTNVTVATKPSGSNLIDLPSALTQQLLALNLLPQNILVKLTYPSLQNSRLDSVAYLGWSGYNTATSTPSISIDPKTCNSLSITPQSQITLEIIINAAKLTSVEVEPLTYEDWDLIQIHAGMMEFTIIQQSRGLCQGQEFVYFVPGSGVSVLMKVVKLLGVSDDDEKEVQFGIFTSNTEISVAPKTRQQANSTKPIGKKPNGLKEEKPI
ncbi:hypothetical protein WICPIJ_007291, partial [Wickerhamomyces pijperi]